MSIILKYWKGEEALWRVWLFGYPASWAVMAAFFILSQKLTGTDSLGITIAGVIYLWFLVSVWKCAKNAKSRFWLFANRGLIIFTGLMASLMLTIMNLR